MPSQGLFRERNVVVHNPQVSENAGMRFLGGHTVTKLVLVHKTGLVFKLILIDNGLLLVDLELDLALLVELFEEVNAVPLEALHRERVNRGSEALLSILLVGLA